MNREESEMNEISVGDMCWITNHMSDPTGPYVVDEILGNGRVKFIDRNTSALKSDLHRTLVGALRFQLRRLSAEEKYLSTKIGKVRATIEANTFPGVNSIYGKEYPIHETSPKHRMGENLFPGIKAIYLEDK